MESTQQDQLMRRGSKRQWEGERASSDMMVDDAAPPPKRMHSDPRGNQSFAQLTRCASDPAPATLNFAAAAGHSASLQRIVSMPLSACPAGTAQFPAQATPSDAHGAAQPPPQQEEQQPTQPEKLPPTPRASLHPDLAQAQESWATSDGGDPAECSLCPYPSAPGYPGNDVASMARVSCNDQILWLTDAAGKMQKVARTLTEVGRRGRKVAELKDCPLEISKVLVKRKKPRKQPPTVSEEQQPSSIDDPRWRRRRIEVTFIYSDPPLSAGSRTQLAHAFRESVGPLRKYLRVKVEGPII